MNYKANYERMLNGIGTTYSKAVTAMCYQCSGYDYKEARECSNKSCPLWIVKNNKKLKKLSKNS